MRQARHQAQWLQDNVRGAIPVRSLLKQEPKLPASVSKRLFLGVAAHDTPQIAEPSLQLHVQIEASARPNLKYEFVRFRGSNP